VVLEKKQMVYICTAFVLVIFVFYGFIVQDYKCINKCNLIVNISFKNNKVETYNKVCLISLDAQHAFDQIEWPYMFATLKRFGFGKKIQSVDSNCVR